MNVLEANAHPIQLPIGAEDAFEAIIDLVEMKATFYADDTGMNVEVRDIPEEHVAKAEEYREKLIEAVADFDEDLMEKYLVAKKLQSQKSKQQFVKLHLLLNSTRLFVVLRSRTKVSNWYLMQSLTTFHHQSTFLL